MQLFRRLKLLATFHPIRAAGFLWSKEDLDSSCMLRVSIPQDFPDKKIKKVLKRNLGGSKLKYVLDRKRFKEITGFDSVYSDLPFSIPEDAEEEFKINPISLISYILVPSFVASNAYTSNPRVFNIMGSKRGASQLSGEAKYRIMNKMFLRTVKEKDLPSIFGDSCIECAAGDCFERPDFCIRPHTFECMYCMWPVIHMFNRDEKISEFHEKYKDKDKKLLKELKKGILDDDEPVLVSSVDPGEAGISVQEVA